MNNEYCYICKKKLDSKSFNGYKFETDEKGNIYAVRVHIVCEDIR